MKNTETHLEDFKINVKIKLSALWTSLMFCYVYGDYFELYVPGKVEELLEGNNMLDSPLKLFLATLLMVVPSLMVILSLSLKPAPNKFLNIIVGVLYTALVILIGIVSMSAWRTFYVFLAFSEGFLTILIVWLAINWPRIPTQNN